MTIADVDPRTRLAGGDAVFPMTVGGADFGADAAELIETFNPATGELLGNVPAASAGDVDHTVRVAGEAFESWRRLSPLERAARLQAFATVIADHAEELVALDVAENGTPVREMRGDIAKGVGQIRRFAGLALEATGRTVPGEFDRLTYTIQQPYGVVARILPFNHPFMFAAGKIAAPLIAGNTVIIKPSEETSLSALRLGELSRGVLPDGVLNVITGHGHVAGSALVRHPGVRRLAFIGSVETGRRIQADAAGAGVKHVSLELGGKNPLVAFADADPEVVASAAIQGMNFTWQGQSCGSTSRLLVQREHYDRVLELLAQKLDALTSGDPTDESTDIGALVSKAQLEKVQRFVELGQSEGARLVYGGETLTDGAFAAGNFVRPALFAEVRPESTLAQEEIFGPVLSVMPFDTYEEAIAIANGVRYGLTASVFTRDLAIAHRFARDVEAGYVWVNEVSRHVPGTGFGGIKESGLGRDENMDELYSYLESKNVHVRYEG